MRRTIVLAVAVLVVGLTVPSSVSAEAPGPSGPAATAVRPVAEGADAEHQPYEPYEAELTRGRFVEFGARLNQRRPNSLYTCRNAFGNFSARFNNCSWEAVNFSTGESFQPPIGRGVITQIRVRVGTRGTGPMRVEVIEALRPVTPTGRICCRLVRRSRIFRPAPGRITTINVNLPIFQSRVPNGNGVYVDQRLALSVLGGNIPIPANFDNPARPSSLSAWYPAWSRIGQERTGPAGARGLMILLRARWRPA
jgi:hypothetical protein